MKGAGALDRRITIQRGTVSRNGLNEPIESWSDLATVYAERRDASASEAYRAQEVGAEITCRFTIRHNAITATVTPADRISHSGKLYNITAVREPDRGRFLELDAVAQAEAAMSDVTP